MRLGSFRAIISPSESFISCKVRFHIQVVSCAR